MMDYILENWFLILAALAVTCMSIYVVVDFSRKPRAEQIKQVREWLLWAVTQAEKELGGGTGQLKLRYVYDLFVQRFPWLSKIVTFDWFSNLVDDALVDMREMLEKNENVKAIVEGEDA